MMARYERVEGRDGFVLADIRFSPAPETLKRRGLIGWVAFTINDRLRVDGVALRSTPDRRAVLSFPARRDGRGRRHFFLRPVSDSARQELEEQIFRALGWGKRKP